jgi:hypothetical protein
MLYIALFFGLQCHHDDACLASVVQFYTEALVRAPTIDPTSTQPSLLVLRFPEQEHGMPVHTGVDTKTDGSPDGLGHLPLVHRLEPGVLAVPDPSEGGDEVRDDGEILFVNMVSTLENI